MASLSLLARVPEGLSGCLTVLGESYHFSYGSTSSAVPCTAAQQLSSTLAYAASRAGAGGQLACAAL